MRKVYILKENEEDGRVLDLLLSKGIDPDESKNPKCPLCGSETLMAYQEGEEYYVLTWDSLTEDDQAARPDAWYLICQEFQCSYEEQVEKAENPEEAEVFDLEESNWSFDEYCAITSRNPSDMKELIKYLESARNALGYRKLGAFLDEARWRYDYGMKQVRNWVSRIPPHRRIGFSFEGERIEARFLTATDAVMLVQTWPSGEMFAVDLEAIDYYGPRRFDQEEEPSEEPDRRSDQEHLISIYGGGDYVIAHGYHLRLSLVDRFGQYHVSTDEAAAAQALGLTPMAENYWTGRLRRADIQARYEKRRMVRVKGYWLQVHGESMGSHSPYVHTEDAAIAADLGLKLIKPIWPDEEIPEHQRQIKHWMGVVPRDQVEEFDEIDLYQWPIPEVKVPGADHEG